MDLICPMCGQPLTGAPSNILPGKNLCSTCAHNIWAFARGENAEEKEQARDYIQTCRAFTSDDSVRSAIDSLLQPAQPQPVQQPQPMPMPMQPVPPMPAPARVPSATAFASRSSHGMFGNIGGKLKMTAKVICWIGIIAFCILGLIMIINGLDSYYGGGAMIASGIALAVAGSLLSWIGSFVLYGFGQLVDNSDIQTRIALEQSTNKKD